MKIVSDDALYELLMIDYQITEVARLNEILKRNGIGDPQLREAICGQFADSNGTHLDQGWQEGEYQGRFWPELLFSKRQLDSSEGLGDIEELVVPGYASNFHEYAGGAVGAYFEEFGESLGHIKVGDASA